MKLAVADSNSRKFSGMIIDSWISKGHEVKYEPGASEFLFEWADLYFIDQHDNNLHYLWQWYQDHPQAKKPKIAVRILDWDFFCQYVPTKEQKYADFIDYAIVIAPHMYELVSKGANYGDKLHLIRPGVDLDKFTFRDNKDVGGNIAMVTGDIWQMKNVMEGLAFFALLVSRFENYRDWKLHWRGQYADHACYMPTAVEHFIKSRGLQDRVILYPPVDDMNTWLEPMQYIINPSIKEAFSYCIAEAMAKGIKPIINNWYGSEDIWPKKYIYNDFDQAITMAVGRCEPEEYRKVVEERYDLKRMLREIDEVLGL